MSRLKDRLDMFTRAGTNNGSATAARQRLMHVLTHDRRTPPAGIPRPLVPTDGNARLLDQLLNATPADSGRGDL
jgi:hypothetical protein